MSAHLDPRIAQDAATLADLLLRAGAGGTVVVSGAGVLLGATLPLTPAAR